MKLLKEHILFVLILLLCAILRLIPLFDYQFTYDELSGLDRTQFNSFSEVIEKGVKIDAHPALVQLIIFYLVKAFGYVTWIIKLPFLLFGFAAIIYGYAFGLRFFSKQAALVSALILAFSLLFVFYAPIARMYITGVFFSVALLYYFFALFFEKDLRWKNYFFLGLFALLSALNHHINSLFAFTVCLSGIFFLNKTNAKAYLGSCALVILFYLPHLPVTLYQFSVPGIGRAQGGWLEAPEFGSGWLFIKTLLGTGKSWMVFLFLILFCFALNKKAVFNKQQLYLFLMFALNFLVVYFYSVYRSPIFQYSVMLFAGSAMLLLVASFINFNNERVFYGVFVVILSLLLYESYFKKDYLHQSVKTVFEYQFGRTTYYKQLYGDEAVYPVFCDADELMKNIYFKKYGLSFDCKIASDSMIANMERVYFVRSNRMANGGTREEKVSSLRLFSEFVAGLKSDYLALSSSSPVQQAIVAEYFPYLVENTQTQAINYKLYSRKKSDSLHVVPDDRIVHISNPANKGHFNYPKIQLYKTGFIMKVDSLAEFPFDAIAELNAITTKEGEMVLAKTTLKIKNNKGLLESCISVHETASNKSYHYNSKSVADYILQTDSNIILYSDYFNGTGYSNIREKATLNCFLWNRGRENFEIIDFEVQIIDYWPMKWHFWD